MKKKLLRMWSFKIGVGEREEPRVALRLLPYVGSRTELPSATSGEEHFCGDVRRVTMICLHGFGTPNPPEPQPLLCYKVDRHSAGPHRRIPEQGSQTVRKLLPEILQETA